MTIHACPTCGSTDIAYDVEATVTVRVVDGEIDYILVVDPFGGDPPHLFCDDCLPDHTPITPAQIHALDALLADTVGLPMGEQIIYQRQ